MGRYRGIVLNGQEQPGPVEIGNGGGSIAWADADGKLRVGPQSAGADPGPAAYGKGGASATLTDAYIYTRRIDPEFLMGGEMQADMENLELALSRLADRVGMTTADTARGIIRLANNNMANAIKLVSINRGHDPRDFSLVAFGGGGSLHAAALASELNIRKVIVPTHAAVFSAWGMLLSDLRRDYVLTNLCLLNASAVDVINRNIKELKACALREYRQDGITPDNILFEIAGQCRYSGQQHSVKVQIPDADMDVRLIEQLLTRFHTRHEREYSYRLPNPVELVGYQLTAFSHVEKPELSRRQITGANVAEAVKGTRSVDYDSDGIHVATIYDRGQLEPKMHLCGPAIIEENGATTVVLPDQEVHVDDYGNLHIQTLRKNLETAA